uniref:DNA-directed RNA polymerase III subunit RPC8 n=1 Tax=Culicoides sonorensis TaxID=179676 RepID=A0A336LRH7_CULSO
MGPISYVVIAGGSFALYPMIKKIIIKKEDSSDYSNSKIKTNAIDNGKFQAYDKSNLSNRTQSMIPKKFELKCDIGNIYDEKTVDPLTKSINDWTTTFGASLLTQTRYSITPTRYLNGVVQAGITDNTLGKYGRSILKASAPALGANSKSNFYRVNVNSRGFPSKTDPHIKVPKPVVTYAGPVLTGLKVISDGLFALAIVSTSAVLLDAYLDEEKSFRETLAFETAKWTGSSVGGYAGATIGAAFGTAVLGTAGGVIGAVSAGMYGSYVGMREVTEFVQNEERRNRVLSLLERFLFCIFNAIKWIIDQYLHFFCMLMEKIEELTELKDTIRIAPEQFHLKLPEAIKDEINRKLANKVLLNVGLCIALKDIKQLGDSIILPGDGASHTVVHYRYIVFRPMIGEVLTGKIRSCNREGVNVSLGFFDDIFIPHTALQHPSRYEEAEQAWVWEYSLEDGDHHDLFMDINETIKFRVTGETFEESSPIGPPVTDDPSNSTNANLEPKVPYRITGSISEPGLGLISWWDQQNQDDEDGQGDEAVDPEEAEDGYEDNE